MLNFNNIMLRRAQNINIQGKKGFIVKGSLASDSADCEKLKSRGFYVYGVRHNNEDIPWVLEDSIVENDHYGYIVLKEPIIFRERKNPIDNVNPRYFVLNNQYSKISEERYLANILNDSHY